MCKTYYSRGHFGVNYRPGTAGDQLLELLRFSCGGFCKERSGENGSDREEII